MWSCSTVILSEGTCWENSGEQTWLILCQHDVPVFIKKCHFIPTMLLPFYQKAHTTGLLNFCSFPWDKGKREKKIASLLLPESLTGSPCRDALLGRCTDQIQMLLECGWGQQRSVEASLQHWLIGFRMKLGVTFLDSDPPPSFSFFLMVLLYSICPVGFAPDASVLYTLLRQCGAQQGADSVTLHVWLFASPLLSV